MKVRKFTLTESDMQNETTTQNHLSDLYGAVKVETYVTDNPDSGHELHVIAFYPDNYGDF